MASSSVSVSPEHVKWYHLPQLEHSTVLRQACSLQVGHVERASDPHLQLFMDSFLLGSDGSCSSAPGITGLFSNCCQVAGGWA